MESNSTKVGTEGTVSLLGMLKCNICGCGNPLPDCLTVAGSILLSAPPAFPPPPPLCYGYAKTDGIINRWSALYALYLWPHTAAQASSGQFVAAETPVHSQDSPCGICGTSFGSPLSHHSTTRPHFTSSGANLRSQYQGLPQQRTTPRRQKYRCPDLPALIHSL
jgi:hypothetical protein